MTTSSDRESGAPDEERVDELAVLALGRIRAAARERGFKPGRVGKRIRRLNAPGKRAGAHPDDRDPQSVTSVLGRMVAERGWETSVNVGAVLGRWPQIVGPQVADHCVPAEFESGVLTLAADSSAWATQLKLMEQKLRERLDAELGVGVVTEIRVQGPAAPTWRKGKYRARGFRGPRDTYG
ncbi:DciA family protein [Spelaeicoccus albus]|uniref:Putative nucleic acid-binding Zn ribbon protein n=1 Tax=Spelaeicoccus albus TaxID=1280376 RepID=A0A7Z0CZU3_9MICO|nr:DciA family protein [Spelaeicoccus albus]NYI66594.1 putative nucleic acid-binding Zn ribbon protein [Spelaeicoccus albus]